MQKWKSEKYKIVCDSPKIKDWNENRNVERVFRSLLRAPDIGRPFHPWKHLKEKERGIEKEERE